MKINQYFVHDAEILEDGLLRIGCCGTDGVSLCTGVYDVAPHSPDYKFWLWLKGRRKRRWYKFGPIAGLDEQAIARYRQQYEHERA